MSQLKVVQSGDCATANACSVRRSYEYGNFSSAEHRAVLLIKIYATRFFPPATSVAGIFPTLNGELKYIWRTLSSATINYE